MTCEVPRSVLFKNLVKRVLFKSLVKNKLKMFFSINYTKFSLIHDDM